MEFKGWPIRCPECESWSFNYTTERGGMSRNYNCSKCDAHYVALWKGKPFSSCMGEPTNTRMEQWKWLKVSHEGAE